MTRPSSNAAGPFGVWSRLFGTRRRSDRVRQPRRRRAVILFESLEGRAVPAALPIATAVPPAIAPVTTAVVTTPRAVTAPAPAAPTAIALTLASDTGTRNDRITNLLTPTIQGRAPAGTLVTVSVTGVAGRPAAQAVGLAPVRVPATGLWTVRLPTLAAGPHTVAARVTNAAGRQSASASYSFTVDNRRPTGQIQFTPNTDTIVLRFSEGVSGVALRNVFLSGRTTDGVQFTNVPLTDPRIARMFGSGSVRLTSSTDGRTWTIKTAYALATPGTYTLRLATTGIIDAAGNAMATSPTLTTRIV
jgi:hypothetical protein